MFLSGIRADASGDRSPWGNFWFEPLGQKSLSGMRVTPESAMRLTTVFACVRVLAETMAVLPFVLYKKNSDGGKTRITNHWLYQLLAKKPNRWQNAFEWREMMMGHLALRGNAYNRIIDDGLGKITDLLPIHPDRIRPEVVNNVFTGMYLAFNPNGSQERIPRGQIFHLRGLSSDGLVGLSPIDVARDSVAIGLSAQEYGARFFKNDARPLGGWIEWDKNFKDTDARKAWSASWQEGQGGKNRGKTAVLTNGMKYHEVGVTNKDSQFLETRQFSSTDLCRIWRVPPHLAGDLSKSTNNNIEQQSLEFVMYTMTPWACRWEGAVEDQLLPPDQDLCVEFDFEGLLRGDSVARTAYYSGGITAGWLTRNEARIKENMNPLPGLDEPLEPMNMQPAGAKPPPAAPKIPPPEPPEPDDDDEELKQSRLLAARLDALELSTATRVIRKERAALERMPVAERASFFAKHADFVAQAMAVDMSAAEKWCAYRLGALEWDATIADASKHHDADEGKLALKLRAYVCAPVVQTSAQGGPQ